MYHNGQNVLRFHDTSSEGFWPVLCGPSTVSYLNNALPGTRVAQGTLLAALQGLIKVLLTYRYYTEARRNDYRYFGCSDAIDIIKFSNALPSHSPPK